MSYILNNTGPQVQEAIDEVRTKTVYGLVTQRKKGLMDPNDKIKLDGLEKDEALSILEIRALLNMN